jgi:hypothetical protein
MLVRLLLTALLSTGLTGCLDSTVGQYRVDEVELREASCTGIDQTRGAAWTSAMRESLITEMLVGEEDGVAGGSPFAQFFRDDSSVFTVELTDDDAQDDENHHFIGTRTDDATSVAAAGLGADFSALLEADNVGCEVEYNINLLLDFRDGDWAAAISSLTIEVGQPFSSDNACIVESCRALYNVAARHTSGIDPGLRGLDES